MMGKQEESITQFKKEFENVCKNGSLGGVYPLKSLSKISYELVTLGNHKLTISFYIIGNIFEEIAQNQEERPVTVEECKKLYSILFHPLKKIIKDVEEDVPEETLIKDLETLIKIYIKGSGQ